MTHIGKERLYQALVFGYVEFRGAQSSWITIRCKFAVTGELFVTAAPVKL